MKLGESGSLAPEWLQSTHDAAKVVLAALANKQGQERCHWHPDILQRLCEIFFVPIPPAELPPRAEFEAECKRYQDEQYGNESLLLKHAVATTAEDDLINNPPHYTPRLPEPIDVIEGWQLNYRLGSVVAYICRHDRKGTPLEDLKKALWFLKREIAAQEQANV